MHLAGGLVRGGEEDVAGAAGHLGVALDEDGQAACAAAALCAVDAGRRLRAGLAAWAREAEPARLLQRWGGRAEK